MKKTILVKCPDCKELKEHEYDSKKETNETVTLEIKRCKECKKRYD